MNVVEMPFPKDFPNAEERLSELLVVAGDGDRGLARRSFVTECVCIATSLFFESLRDFTAAGSDFAKKFLQVIGAEDLDPMKNVHLAGSKFGWSLIMVVVAVRGLFDPAAGARLGSLEAVVAQLRQQRVGGQVGAVVGQLIKVGQAVVDAVQKDNN